MSWELEKFIGMFLVLAIILTGCSEDSTAPENNPPIANAGADQTVSAGDTVVLNGSASNDPEGSTLVYLWEIISIPEGSAATLTNPIAVSASFIADEAGIYTVRLTVTDGAKTATDNMVVTAEAVSSPVEINSDINTDTRLVDIFDDPNKIDYILTRVVNVTADLIIDPGVKISVASGSRLDIETGGLIGAVGTEAKPIIFVGDVATPGYWHGLYIVSNNPGNELTYVNVAHAGGGYYANVYVKYTGQLKISNCILSEASTYGLEAEKGAKLPVFSNNAFNLNQEAALRIPSSLLGSIDSESVYAGSNVNEYIEVFSSDVETVQTWPSTDAPLRFNGVTNIESEVTIEAGANLIFADGARIDVEEDGILKAIGTVDDMITFKGEVATPGYWDGIIFFSNNPANELAYVEVAHGGRGYNANVYVRYTGQLKISNSTMSESSTYGLEAQDGATLAAFSNNTFNLNQEAALRIPSSLVGSIDSESVYAGSNVNEYIEVFSSDVETVQTWPATDAPLRFGGVTNIESEVTIEAGANLIFDDGARIDVEDLGTLIAVGTASEMITFKGEVATPGYWDGIIFFSNNPANELTYVEVAHGGRGYNANVYVRYTGQLIFTNSNSHDSLTYGLEVQKGGQVTLSNNTYADNTLGDENIEE